MGKLFQIAKFAIVTKYSLFIKNILLSILIISLHHPATAKQRSLPNPSNTSFEPNHSNAPKSNTFKNNNY